MVGKSELELMLEGYGLTTARFHYGMPDHPSILQIFVWQAYDLAPKFPRLHGFIDFWRETLDGPLRSVEYTHQRLIAPSEWRSVKGEIAFH